jgi:integrase
MGRRIAKEVGALELKQPPSAKRLADGAHDFTKPGRHPVGGVSCLYLLVTDAGTKSWVYRPTIAGKRRDMGLGGFPTVTLEMARDLARNALVKIRNGIDPIEDAKRAKSRLHADRAKDVTFEACALKYLTDHEKEWTGSKSYNQWLRSLKSHVFPKIGKLFVRDVGVPQVLEVLEPIWHTKTETASRVRGRLESILSAAKVQGLRDGPNPAAWKENLEHMLASAKKIKVVKHFPSLHYSELGAFMQRLRKADGQGARALEFVILTASRANMVCGARWSEVNFAEKTWTIPKERMKGPDVVSKKEHRVPLSQAAIDLLKAQPLIKDCDLIFPSSRGTPISDATMGAVLKRLKVPAVPHGFRATFKTWATEITRMEPQVVEIALAHVIADKVEEAYQRGDLFLKRRVCMDRWAEFCAKVYETREADVVQLYA